MTIQPDVAGHSCEGAWLFYVWPVSPVLVNTLSPRLDWIVPGCSACGGILQPVHNVASSSYIRKEERTLMIHTFKLVLSMQFVAVFLLSAVAFAAVTFDPATGTGFVGKGDVQLAFGWNNAQMQANHQAVTFKYVAAATYAFDCEWYTGPEHNRKRHENTKTAESGINISIAADSRKTGQWTGWHLKGFTASVPAPAAPTDADCGAEGNEMKTLIPGSVELLTSSGGLYAVHAGSERLLP